MSYTYIKYIEYTENYWVLYSYEPHRFVYKYIILSDLLPRHEARVAKVDIYHDIYKSLFIDERLQLPFSPARWR